jgi:hypothetical protein
LVHEAVNEIVNAKKKITAEAARELAEAFGTSQDLWRYLETAYQLSKANAPDPAIAKRAAELMDKITQEFTNPNRPEIRRNHIGNPARARRGWRSGRNAACWSTRRPAELAML